MFQSTCKRPTRTSRAPAQAAQVRDIYPSRQRFENSRVYQGYRDRNRLAVQDSSAPLRLSRDPHSFAARPEYRSDAPRRFGDRNIASTGKRSRDDGGADHPHHANKRRRMGPPPSHVDHDEEGMRRAFRVVADCTPTNGAGFLDGFQLATKQKFEAEESEFIKRALRAKPEGGGQAELTVK